MKTVIESQSDLEYFASMVAAYFSGGNKYYVTVEIGETEIDLVRGLDQEGNYERDPFFLYHNVQDQLAEEFCVQDFGSLYTYLSEQYGKTIHAYFVFEDNEEEDE